METTGNPFVHLELNSPDAGKAKEFYGNLLGWKFEDKQMGPGFVYSTFKPAEGPGGGIFTMKDGGTGWLAYVGVADIKASTAKAKELGAGICTDCMEIPGVGWATILDDPTGCRMALFQPLPGTGK